VEGFDRQIGAELAYPSQVLALRLSTSPATPCPSMGGCTARSQWIERRGQIRGEGDRPQPPFTARVAACSPSDAPAVGAGGKRVTGLACAFCAQRAPVN
jgi:hypothetical protein